MLASPQPLLVAPPTLGVGRGPGHSFQPPLPLHLPARPPRGPRGFPPCYNHASPSSPPCSCPSQELSYPPFLLPPGSPHLCTHLPVPGPGSDAHLKQSAWRGEPWTSLLLVTDPCTLQGGSPCWVCRLAGFGSVFLFLVKALLKYTL